MAKLKINYNQLPVKAHYFFFMAAMGPIVPFLPVYGKQLGVSPMVMGFITSILPLLFLLAKPLVGLLVDHFRKWRKFIFMLLIAGSSFAFICLYFLPPLPIPVLPEDGFRNVSCSTIDLCELEDSHVGSACFSGRLVDCRWRCDDGKNFERAIYFHPGHKGNLSRVSSCLSKNDSMYNVSDARSTMCADEATADSMCNVTCDKIDDNTELRNCLYTSPTFWGFVLFMSLGNIGFNVLNCISDAICFDVLGDGGQMGYGRQRLWGTIGFGIAAILSGYAVDVWSKGDETSYTPAFVLIFVFTCFDLLCSRKLELPVMAQSESIVKDVWKLLQLKSILIFLCFATLVGILDSFIIYFMFWYVEDLAQVTGHTTHVKLIEGLIVGAETLCGEVVFFSLSGKILKKIGYGYSFVFCFFCYSLRLGLISLAPTPWWILPIELVMQGPTYALCYTTIVAYASAVSPPGTSATIQGIVAGMDDGFGFAVGSLLGGYLYKKVGGVRTLQIYSILAAVCSLSYFILHVLYLKRAMLHTGKREDIEYTSPMEATNEKMDEEDRCSLTTGTIDNKILKSSSDMRSYR